MRRVLRKIIADFQERELPRLTLRELRIAELPNKASCIVGMRRTGKTWFLFQEMGRLLARGAGKEQLLHINFEDERLQPLTARQLHLITDTFFELFPQNKDRVSHVFFDEVQNVPGWERFIRRLLDTEKMTIYLTGSSSRLLGKELATAMRGRSLLYEMFPFSFGEALRHRGISFSRTALSSRDEALIRNQFHQHLELGGFAEVQKVEPSIRTRILQDYLDTVLFRDLVERHGIANLPLARYLIRHLLGNIGAPFSVHKFYKDVRSQGFSCSKNTIHEYLTHLTEAYLLFLVEVCSQSVRRRMVLPRKVYAIDTGLVQAVSWRMAEARGVLLENVVFLALRRQGKVTYYRTQQGHEVDFVREKASGRPELVQVCEDLSAPGVREREYRALLEAMDELALKKSLILTGDEEGEQRLRGKRIVCRPVWRWLLEVP